MEEQELGKRIYEAAKMAAAAFYTHNQKDYDYWSEIFDDLTVGMSQKKVYALEDKADFEFSITVQKRYDAIIKEYRLEHE